MSTLQRPWRSSIAATFALAALAVAPGSASAVGIDTVFLDDFAGFAAAVPGTSVVTIDFDGLSPGVTAANTVVGSDTAGVSVTLVDIATVLATSTVSPDNWVDFGTTFGTAGLVEFSESVLGVGATFSNIVSGAFGGAEVNVGFDASENGAVNSAAEDDVAFPAGFAVDNPDGSFFLGFTSTSMFDAIGISSFPSFGTAAQVDDLVLLIETPDTHQGGGGPSDVPLPASLPLFLVGLAAFAGVTRTVRRD